ncbi:hypothetical protein INT48_001710 [Thamnidium elegans]|uniref:Uncharacterized protein n=1 Tax=Thamnidium elegans TaxID=101142 RepID=A0A8H7SQH3_9FUNG|nr:hypothetical protein INT48_001710 [Thamnidium elegans]
MSKDNYITYDKHKLNVLSWGDQSVDDNEEDTVQIDVSGKKLYQLFENGKDRWDQDDLFTLTAVSDFIRLSVEELIKDSKGEIKDSDALHYIFIVPSEWEEEIREVLIRPIFVQANLISKDDHPDRLLFCCEIESAYYYLSDYFTKMTRNTILDRIVAVEENQVSIKLYLILIGNPLFDFSGSVTRPKIMNSNEMFLTSDDVKNGIRKFIKIKFSFDVQEDTILSIMKELDNDTFTRMVSNRDKEEASYLMQPFITDENISELDKHQEERIKSIRPFDICAEISKQLPNNLEQLLPNSLVKEYSIVKFNDEYTSEIELDQGLLQWSRFMFEYNRIYFASKYIVPENPTYKSIDDALIVYGAFRYSISTIQNSSIYSKPRILSTEHSVISSSIFLNSKPDAIMNIDILLDSTALSFSLLDENGLVKKIWDHDCFVPDIGLRSLGSFFIFSEVVTLNVKNSFITFVEGYLTDESNISSGVLNKDMLIEIENILSVESHNKDIMVSIQQQVYIKAFVLIYMIYINVIVSRKTLKITGDNDDIKTGYAITVEKMLLQKLLVTEDELRDMIYASNLIQENDSYKKLRITTQGQGLLPVIQQSFKLSFPLKSFFVVAQLHKDYVQLTLNQVVTESGSDQEDQETIIIQEEIIHTPNIYDSLCFNMWSNITEDSSLIQLCDTHKGYNDNELLDIFSLENQAEFKNNLKEYISKDILNKNLTTRKADKTTVYLSNSYDETDYFLYEQRIDIDHYTIPKLPNQLLQPILQRESCLYKGFQVGVLRQAYSKNVGFGFEDSSDGPPVVFKSNREDTDTVLIDDEKVFPLFKNGDKMNESQLNRVFYLNKNQEEPITGFCLCFFKLKPVASLRSDELIGLEHTTEKFRDDLFLNSFITVILRCFILKLKRLETRLTQGKQQYLRNP